MKTSILKKEIHQAIDDTKDNEILSAVYTILKKASSTEEELVPLTSAQKKDLDKRLADHKAGKLKYYTIEQVRSSVLSALKK
jgi:putative addiction module component (TIGR02574 family)